MKTKFNIAFIILNMWMSTELHAQWINSITILPANPTATDTITVLAACSFPSGGCSEHTKFINVVGNDIFAQALHCLGPLSFICNYTDTFTINPLPAGNYTFHLQIDGGFGPSPCTPGIVPGPMDSIPIIVSPLTGLEEYVGQDAVFAYPNPVKDRFQIKGLNQSEFPALIELFSVSGKLVKKISLINSDQYFEIGELPEAMYQLYIKTATQNKIVVQLLKTK